MRAMLALALVCTLASLAAAVPSARACSCSSDTGPVWSPASPWFSASAFPTNGFFTSSLEWRDESGAPLSLARDAALSDALGFEVRRPTADVAPGSVLFPIDDCPASGECRHRLVFAAPDLTPPSVAELRDVTVHLAQDAPETGTSCQFDSMVLEVGGTDDVTPNDELITLMFLGATADEAATTEAFGFGFAYDAGSPSSTLVSTIVLGGAEGHRREGGPLPASGAFCFAVALMDWAGNIGARSEARCVDTRDPSDPATQLVAYDPPCSGPFCAVGPARPRGGGLWLAGLAGIVMCLRARRARAASNE